MADVDYEWKGADKGGGVEIVSSKMAQFDLLRVETLNDASVNSKGESGTLLRHRHLFSSRFSSLSSCLLCLTTTYERRNRAW